MMSIPYYTSLAHLLQEAIPVPCEGAFVSVWVTAIEIRSPVNKRPSPKAFEGYRLKEISAFLGLTATLCLFDPGGEEQGQP